ncbi:MAG: acetylxylan esterase, partial [Lactococcus lactis]|nr:acetylxylan esterase [Lactococcus lactis]
MTKINNWQDYQGSSLKPEDFDKFWDEKINLVSNHQFEFELIEKNLSSKVAKFY